MVYNVIGLMSGSSLDGLDICYAQYEEIRGKWSVQILAAECIPYTETWLDQLRHATTYTVPEFLRLHTAYGRYTGECIKAFMQKHDLEHKVHFIASHGHTIWHEPAAQTTWQLGEGASIAAIAGLPVISDLRAMDVALGGQGAPIVPIGDRLLFPEYDALLNIGGIANITLRQPEGEYAFDICAANQALNCLAQKAGKPYDAEGRLAASGQLISEVWDDLNLPEYYRTQGPKSLSNEQAMAMVSDFVDNEAYSIEDRLHTMVHFITARIIQVMPTIPNGEPVQKKLLLTGGGAFNTYLVETLREKLAAAGTELIVPDAQTVMYKEAMVMGLIGILRWREEINVHSEITGATRSSIGGAYWMGA